MQVNLLLYGPLRGATGEKRVTVEPAGNTVSDLLDAFLDAYPRVSSHLLDEDGDLRPSVRVVVDGDRATLEHRVTGAEEVKLFPAMRGG